MATTNFAALSEEQLTIWGRTLWREARNQSFVSKFLGSGPDAMIQRITELSRTKKGARAILTLIADLEGDGVVGDRQLEGNEEPMKSYETEIRIDMLRHANRHEGKMADQRSVAEFRRNSRNALAYWLGDRIDQVAFLTLSGVDYSMKNNGVARIGSDLPNLDFNADIRPPTDLRRARWNATTGSLEIGGATSDITPADRPQWDTFVELRAFLRESYVKPVRTKNGMDMYHVFLSPTAMAKLKLDPKYHEAVKDSQKLGNKNPLFTGNSVMVDGFMFHDFRYVYNTRGAPTGSKWGSAGDVDGCQILVCGAQAMGMCDLGTPEWIEKKFDYDNQPGIAIEKMFGLLKPQYNSIYANNTVQDFGVFSLYCSQQ